LADAEQALSIDPGYHKAYSRLGHAHFCLENYGESVEAYKKALEADPHNANLKQSLATAEQKLTVSSATRSAAPTGMPDLAGGLPNLGGMDLGGMLNNPGFMQMGILFFSDGVKISGRAD
jgi:small glutamine-rich tetratricopeptide repeat-containing protein alpha